MKNLTSFYDNKNDIKIRVTIVMFIIAIIISDKAQSQPVHKNTCPLPYNYQFLILI